MLLGDRYLDVRSLVDRLNVQVQIESNGWLVGLCPLHDDKHRSFAVNEQSGAWICYARCGSGGLVSLVSRIFGVSESEARQRLLEEGELLGSDELLNLLLRDKRRPSIDSTELFYERGKIHRYIVDRGFTKETLRAFNVGWDEEAHAVVIPVIEHGSLVGLIKRRVHPGEFEPPYDYRPRGWHKSDHLFALDRCQGTEVVLVEGALDAMWLHQFGFPGAAILGGSLSATQTRKLLGRARSVLLAFDNAETDATGAKLRDSVSRTLVGHGIQVKDVRIPSGRKDVQECQEEELVQAIQDAQLVYSPTS